MEVRRCSWVTDDVDSINYHDHEWGIVRSHSYDDRYLFEILSLEGAQAGLSWMTILKRRKNYRDAFNQFDPEIVSKYDEQKVKQLLNNEGIIRNERKIRSVINNAKAFIRVQQEFGSFSTYIWDFVNNKPIVNEWDSFEQAPAYTPLSNKISLDLKKRGFTFVGPIICYTFMQAIGMVNDHAKECFLYNKLNTDEKSLGQNSSE